MDGVADGARAAAAHADHLRHQSPDFCAGLTAYSWVDGEKLRRMSIIEEGHEKNVRMAHLAIVGSHAVNGVSQLHSDLIKTSLVPEFVQLIAGKIQQQDEWSSAAALAVEGESASVETAVQDHRR